MPVDMFSLIAQFSSSKKTTTTTGEASRTENMAKDAKTTVYSAAFPQQAAKAGLLVTNELDNAIAQCQAKVDRIGAVCRRRNMKFRDIEFDLEEDRERCLHGLNTPAADKFAPADVLRVSQIFENPQFVIEGATSGDIVQGDIGNCWFLSALATVSTVPGLVEKFCVARDEKVGIYGFIFYRDSGWVAVVIDDMLYISIPKYEELTAKEKKLYHEDKDAFVRQARRGSKSLYFAKSGTENETWVPLVEKAFAKLHGDYASIQGGFASEGVEDLTGGVSTVMHTSDVLDPERFWNEELMRANTDRLFGCYIFRLPGAATPSATINGLMTSHAYSIIKCVEHNGRRFVRIRNPWGRSEWTGRWADGSREWHGEWLAPETLAKLGHRFGEDGEFVMEYEDFLTTWTMVERSRLFDDTWRMSSLWLNVTSLPPPSAWTFGDVSFAFSIPRASFTVIVLAQLDARYFKEISGYSQWSLEFVLFKKDDPEPLGASLHSNFWGRSVNLELELEAGEYVVHVRMDRRAIREKEYFKEGLPQWDWRKLGRVWSEAALSRSIASNFDAEYHRDLLPVPLEKYAGRDLTRLELETQAAVQMKRDTLRAQLLSPSSEPSGPPFPRMPNVTSPQDDKPLPQVPARTTTTVEESTERTSLMVVQDVVDTPVIRSPSFPLPSTHLERTLEPAIPEQDEEELLAPTVFVDQVDDEEEESPPHHHLHSEDDPISPTGGPDPIAMDRPPSPDMQNGPGPMQDEPEQDEELPHEYAQAGPPPADMPVHERFMCDGCRMAPIVGIMYVCMHADCPDYDLCADCITKGIHPKDHTFMRVEQPSDMDKMQRTSMPGDDDDVVLGLRVYTHRDAPATIAGQLRHGRVVTWSKEK